VLHFERYPLIARNLITRGNAGIPKLRLLAPLSGMSNIGNPRTLRPNATILNHCNSGLMVLLLGRRGAYTA